MKMVTVILVLVIVLFVVAGCSTSATPPAATATASKPSAEGMATLPSGLQYKEIKAGTGASPNATDKVEVHYRGQFEDGREFDSSYSRGQPATFGVSDVIKGWTEALKLMKEGARWNLRIPPDLAYGAMGMPPVIPPNTPLFFEVELIRIVK